MQYMALFVAPNRVQHGLRVAKAEEISNEALAKAIRNGDFYASEGPSLRVVRQGNKLIIG